MVGKRVQFDDETWEAISMFRTGKKFQELAEEAFEDVLKKHKQPIGLKAALKYMGPSLSNRERVTFIVHTIVHPPKRPD